MNEGFCFWNGLVLRYWKLLLSPLRGGIPMCVGHLVHYHLLWYPEADATPNKAEPHGQVIVS